MIEFKEETAFDVFSRSILLAAKAYKKTITLAEKTLREAIDLAEEVYEKEDTIDN